MQSIPSPQNASVKKDSIAHDKYYTLNSNEISPWDSRVSHIYKSINVIHKLTEWRIKNITTKDWEKIFEKFKHPLKCVHAQ